MAKKQQHKAEPRRAVKIEVPPRQDPIVTERMSFGLIHWVVGTTPKGMTRNDVTDPPTNGCQHVLVFVGEKRWMAFCPFTFTSYQLTIGGYEQKSFEGPRNPFTKDMLAELITRKWEEHAERNHMVDYNMAARVLKELGAPVPTAMPTAGADDDPNKERGGKPVADKLLKPVKQNGKRGKVLAWFLETGEARSIREAMAEFEASRSSILSYLHNCNKDHGIGYTLIGDTALVTLPADVGDDLWA